MLNKTFKYTDQNFFEPTKKPAIKVDDALLFICFISGFLIIFLG